jgi:hypothetical protein
VAGTAQSSHHARRYILVRKELHADVGNAYSASSPSTSAANAKTA